MSLRQSSGRLLRALAGVSACALASTGSLAAHAQAAPPAAAAPVGETAAGPTLAQLTALRGQLGSANSARRETALLTLLELEDNALPAVRARLSLLAGHYGDGKAVASKLPALRRMRDLTPRASAQDQAAALRAALEHDPSNAMQTAVELFAILRALERQRSLTASDVLVNQLVALDPPLFRSELAGANKRLGKRLVPGYLRAARDSTDPVLHKLAREGLASFNVATEAQLFGLREPDLLGAVIDVMAAAPRSDDLSWLVASLDDPRPVVRAAARRATRLRTAAAVDLLRARMADLIGEEPDPTWQPDYLLEQLVQRMDAAHEPADIQALAQAREALSRDDLPAAERALDLALHDTSPSSRALAAKGYLALAEIYERVNRPEQALRAYRRAYRLQPDDAASGEAHDAALERRDIANARVLYLEAEQRAAQGIADLQGLRRAARLEPTHPAAAQLLSELSGTRIDRDQDLRRQLGLVAAALLAVAALLVLWIRALNRRAVHAPSTADATKSPSP